MNKGMQRTKIAKTCGTLACPGCGWEHFECWSHDYKVPDYLHDLNAMHEAEKILDHDQREQYWGTLCHMIDAVTAFDSCISATAAQRAEAFLKTVGQWEESKAAACPLKSNQC